MTVRRILREAVKSLFCLIFMITAHCYVIFVLGTQGQLLYTNSSFNLESIWREKIDYVALKVFAKGIPKKQYYLHCFGDLLKKSQS